MQSLDHSAMRLTLLLVLVVSLTSCGKSQQIAGPDDNLQNMYNDAFYGPANPSLVHELAAKANSKRTALLGAIAVNAASMENQSAAVEELAKAGTAEGNEIIALLLAPHVPMALRSLAAESLDANKCDRKCTEAILLYLYRTSAGEESFVDRGWNDSMEANLKESRQQIEAKLKVLLGQNSVVTKEVLKISYGLGSVSPSKFSIEMVSQLKLPQACQLLLNSRQRQAVFKETGRVDLKRLTEAIESLGCRDITAPSQGF